MTAITDAPPAPRGFALSAAWRLALLVAAATALALLMAAPLVATVMHGGFGDPDDAMRLAEVRAWMGGQPWFDVTALRLDPPTGATMHWSRLVDVPNAALIRLFGLLVDRARAEALDRIVMPTLCLAALYLGMARLGTILLGRAARGPAIVGTLLSGATLVQFQPGRIGHHAPETVALVFAVGAALASVDRRRAAEAGTAGVLVALSLAMSLETLPLLGTLCLAMVLAWVVRGHEGARALAWFGAGLGVAAPLLFAVTIPLDHWSAPVSDAFGIGHIAAALAGAAGALALVLATPRLASIPARCAAAALVGAGIAGLLVLIAPQLWRSPFAAVDPLVRSVWLDHVAESQPLAVFMDGHRMLGLAVALPALAGTLASLVAAGTLRGTAAVRFAVIGLLSLVGLCLGLWQVRAFASVTPLALCGGLFAVMRLRGILEARGFAALATAAPMAILPFTSTAWVIALPVESSPAAACLDASALAPLAGLAPGRAVAPLDAGAHLIEATALDVFAAPYHRDDDGNRFVLDVWRSLPDEARARLHDRKVTYVLFCPGMGDIERVAALAPDGLAARLKDGDVPPFLAPMPLQGTPYRVFRVAR